MTTELTRDQIINLISPSSKNSEHHDLAFANRVIDAMRALTQRPAAQTEREAFEGWYAALPNNGRKAGLTLLDAWQARASLPAPQQATPDKFADASKMVPPVALRSVRLTRDTAGMCVVRVNGRVAIRDNGDIIDHTATLEWFADTQQATPEPVGEVVGTVVHAKLNGQAKPWVTVALNQDADLPDGTKLYVGRPAPGVPDGWHIFRIHNGIDVHTPDGGVCYVEAKAAADRRIPEEVLHALCCDLLAAAQAKGGE